MNEYLVAVYIDEEHTVTSTVIVEANNKPDANEESVRLLEEKGIKTYGTNYCVTTPDCHEET